MKKRLLAIILCAVMACSTVSGGYYFDDEIPLATQGGGFVDEKSEGGSFSDTPQQGQGDTNDDGTWGDQVEDTTEDTENNSWDNTEDIVEDTQSNVVESQPENDEDEIAELHLKAYNNASFNKEVKVYVNGSKLYLDAPATITSKGRTMVPLRAIFEALGADVYWDGKTKTVTAYRDNDYVKLTINDNYMYTSTGTKTLDQPAYIASVGRTLVPARAISEAFDSDVKWYADKRLVSVVSRNEKYREVISSGASTESVQSHALTYAPYTGLDYTKLTTNQHRINALNTAKKMVTVQWTAPCDFVTWASSKGAYNSTVATDGTKTSYFKKGKTYTGVPYSMVDHTYDEVKWIELLNKGITADSMKKRYGSYPVAGTAKGMDCSYLVYSAFNSCGVGEIGYQTTKAMLNSTKYNELNSFDEMLPGDIFLKDGHTMLFIGKTADGKYAIFEASAQGVDGSATSRCVYKEYTKDQLSDYEPYRFYAFVD